MPSTAYALPGMQHSHHDRDEREDRDPVATDPALAQARLHSTIVRAPAAVTDAAIAAFDLVRVHPIRTATRCASVGGAPVQAESSMAAIALPARDG